MPAAAGETPSNSSYYIDDAYYQDLVDSFGTRDLDGRQVRDRDLRDTCQDLLLREARLLDQGRFRDWLDLFVGECAYWIPATPEGGDPRGQITVAFHDRRQLEDKVFRLETGFAWSQQPPSRTVRQVTNLEVFRLDDPQRLLLRSNFLVTEFRAGETRLLAGHALHLLSAAPDGFRIRAKQVNLVDCDQNLRNLSLIL